MLDIYVDADACPVKQEVYRVAARYEMKVFVVANGWMRVPKNDRVELVLVKDEFDAADDWIVEHLQEKDIVVTGDILLAARCLEKEARAIGPKGRIFKEETIGEAKASREVMVHLRETGTLTSGPAPLQKKDRSRFLQKLDEIIQALRR